MTSTGWPLRAWGLTLLGGLVGLACHFIVPAMPDGGDPGASRLALASFLGIAGLAFAYVVERERLPLAAGFAIIAGGIVASVVHRGGTAGFDSIAIWRLVCAGLAVAIAAPLFQAWRDTRPGGGETGLYAAAHDRAWTNLVLWFASFAFVGIVWALLLLLGALFNLIGIDALIKLLERRPAGFALSGAALGAGIGLLRDRDAILGTLQKVITTVLGVLAPVLGIGLLLFIAALPFTGIEPLWEATKSTTPILLACIIAGLVLVNAVIGDSPADEARNALLRWGAMTLAATMLVLGIIAAVSVSARIRQYGLTPDRLWAVTFTIIACAYGAAYLAALVAGRSAGWPGLIRRGNLHLAFGLVGLALLLATPLIDFGAISARSQLARLESGRVTADAFDWAALRFDFGPVGKAAVERLAATGAPAVRPAAKAALATESRHDLVRRSERAAIRRQFISLTGAAIPPALLDAMERQNPCWNGKAPCIVVYRPGDTTATIIADPVESFVQITLVADDRGGWRRRDEPVALPELATAAERDARRDRLNAALRTGKAETRIVARRQLVIDGQPVGEAFE